MKKTDTSRRKFLDECRRFPWAPSRRAARPPHGPERPLPTRSSLEKPASRLRPRRKRSGNPFPTGKSASASSETASASSGRRSGFRIIRMLPWRRSAICFRTVAAGWRRRAVAQRRIRRSKNWSRTIRSKRSSSRPTPPVTSSIASRCLSTANTLPAPSRPFSVRSRPHTNCSSASSRADGSTCYLRPRHFATTVTLCGRYMKPARSANLSTPRASTSITARSRPRPTKTGGRDSPRNGIRPIPTRTTCA